MTAALRSCCCCCHAMACKKRGQRPHRTNVHSCKLRLGAKERWPTFIYLPQARGEKREKMAPNSLIALGLVLVTFAWWYVIDRCPSSRMGWSDQSCHYLGANTRINHFTVVVVVTNFCRWPPLAIPPPSHPSSFGTVEPSDSGTLTVIDPQLPLYLQISCSRNARSSSIPLFPRPFLLPPAISFSSYGGYNVTFILTYVRH